MHSLFTNPLIRLFYPSFIDPLIYLFIHSCQEKSIGQKCLNSSSFLLSWFLNDVLYFLYISFLKCFCSVAYCKEDEPGHQNKRFAMERQSSDRAESCCAA